MKITRFIDKTIREIALEAPATTRVFEEFKIDYCCGGRRSISEVCDAAGIDPKTLMERIEQAVIDQEGRSGLVHPEDMPPGELIDYILDKHHIFTSNEIERLTPLMAKVVMRHGEQHPELFRLQEIFTALTESLLPHMRKEENVLFPYIHTLVGSSGGNGHFSAPPFGTVKNPISVMMSEHETDGERLEEMRRVTSDYFLPEGACPSYTALYAGLEDLERDLHRHIHLENNVLFPAAAELELRAAAFGVAA
jgi:regulator of cell morphogenesis and NO signaling